MPLKSMFDSTPLAVPTILSNVWLEVLGVGVGVGVGVRVRVAVGVGVCVGTRVGTTVGEVFEVQVPLGSHPV